VVLHGKDSSTALLGVGDDSLFVDWLDGERIHDPDVDAVVSLQLLFSLQGLVQSYAGSDHEDGIRVGLGDDLGFADL
jgi:hypothetical protein